MNLNEFLEINILLPLNSSYIYNFLFLTPSLYSDILLNNLIESFFSFLFHFILLINDFIYLLFYILIYILKIIFYCLPYLIKLFHNILEFHQKQLKLFDLIIEGILLLLFLIYFLFRKRIINYWKLFISNLSKKYEVIARIIPHILFFSIALLLSYFGQKFLVFFSSRKIFPIFSLILPLSRLFQNRYSNKSTIVSKERLIVLWIVLGTYSALSEFISMIPFISLFTSIIPFLKEFSLVVSRLT